MVESIRTKWERKLLGEIAEINPRSTDFSLSENEEVSFVPMAAVSEVTATITRKETRLVRDVRKGFTAFREGDILFAKITPCMENGKIAIASNLVSGFGFGSTEFHVIRPLSGFSTRLIWYFLRNQSIREYAAQNMIGSAGQQRVPAIFLRNLVIPLPLTFEEQERIADLLDEVDAARLLSTRISQEIQGFVSALFVEEFGDPASNPKGWEVVSLGDKNSVIGFTYGTNARSRVQGIGIPILRIPNILSGASGNYDILLERRKRSKQRER